MPAAVVAIAAAAAGYGAASLAVTAGLLAAGSIGFAVVAAVVGTAVSYGLSAAFGLNRVKRTNTSQDRKQIIRSSVEPRQVIYGRARVSGPMVYASSSGADQRFLHLVVPLAGHVVNRIGTVWVNDHAVNDADMDGSGMVVNGGHALVGKCRIRKYLGTQTTADPDLVAESTDGWTVDHVLRGVAYLYIRLEYSQDAFASGLSAISAEVEGRKVYDPRSGLTGYSTNWALCVRDYLKADFGLACADDEIDEGSFAVAANISDEQVQLDEAGTLFQARYTMDGSFKLDETPLDVMDKMMTAGGGALVYVQGRYQVHAGSYVAPTDVLTASDFAGDMEIVTKPSRSEIFNAAKGTFIDPGSSWQAAEFPAYESPTYIAEDGEKIWRDLEFAFTNDGTRCQRLAKQIVLTERDSLTFSAPMKYSSLRFSVMQNVAVQMPELGWNNKPFRVRKFTFDPVSGGVTLMLREDGPGSYGWLYDDAAGIPPAPDTDLVSPLNIPAPGFVSATPTTALNADGATVPALLVEWPPALHAFITAYEVQWRVAPSGSWSAAEVPAPTTRFTILPVVVGQLLNIRVRSVASLVRSAWTGIVDGMGQPDLTPPGPPAAPSVTPAILQFVVRWTNAADSDLARVEIWESASSDLGAAYKQGESTSDFFVRQIAANQTRWFWLRSVDRSGNHSPMVYAGTGTSRFAETGDIGEGAVSNIALDNWTGDISAAGGAEILSLEAGDALYGGNAVALIDIEMEGEIYSTGGETPTYFEPRGYVQLKVDNAVVRQVEIRPGSSSIHWGGYVAAGVKTFSVDVSAIDGARITRGFLTVQIAKR